MEICADSVESATIAESAGAGRLELCSALAEGGVTPSAGLIESVRRETNIRLHVLIRPRSGDFMYNDSEFSVMRRDIDTAGERGPMVLSREYFEVTAPLTWSALHYLLNTRHQWP